MRIMVLLISALFIVNNAHASFTEKKAGKEEKYSSFSPAEKAATDFFAQMSRKEYEQLTGRHLSLLERFAFRWMQKHVYKKFDGEKQSKGFNSIGFFVPLLLGIVGIPLGLLTGIGILAGVTLSFLGVCAIAIFSKDKNMHKWAWIGFGAYIVGLIVWVIILLASGYFAE